MEINVDVQSVNDLSIVVRLLLAVICGGIIGLERGRAGRPAGFRTHILVCLGSALAVLTNQYVYQEYGVGDPVRIGAQVISGIGFLGAGTIIVTGRHQVKGLTTAAGLWATACMGLAIGIGFYKAAIISCVLIAFATIALHRFDNYMLSKARNMDIYIEYSKDASVNTIIEIIKSNAIQIEGVEIIKPSHHNSSSIAAIMTLRLHKKLVRLDVVANISRIEGIEFVEEV